ncbi:MAG: queuosine precursor transporter [Candidatus Brocadiae bacterium]|nr:queuosine precursor transporter [Candidatus Brocadiia bacterium]
MNDNKKNYVYYETITVFFVAVLLISNIASAKIVQIGNLVFDGGTLLFPLSYILGDILTEVYGYSKSRKVIWKGFACAFLMSCVLYLVQILPPAKDWPFQKSYEEILGMTWRIVFASLVAFCAGEFSNAYILAKMKIFTKGKHLWLRTIGSTLFGEMVDTFLFCFIAFYGIYSHEALFSIVVSNYILKCTLEILCTPLTYKVVNFLKEKEGTDHYDYNTNFNPFSFKD